MMRAEIPQLLEKYLDNQMNEAELSEFRKQLESLENRASFEKAIGGILQQNRFSGHSFAGKEAVFESIVGGQKESVISTIHRVHFLRTTWFRYAAVLLLIAGAAAFLYLRNEIPQKDTIANSTPDILPGGNKAILTLSDGSAIVLDNAANGSLASQGNTKILKLDAGSIAYHAGAATGEVLYNTISTPIGGQYQVVLPDGSKAWLNAKSSIKFPAAFSHNREVEITGEIYFEIASAKDRPFFVNLRGTQVQVLGTQFNVNTYEDETDTKTTLIEGSIKILEGKNEKILQPGQQAISQAGMGIQVKNADVNVETAWKNGMFYFNGSEITSIMRQLARWYNIEVEYRGEVKDRLVCEMPRNKPLSQILEMLGKTELVKFTLTGKKVIVE